MRIVRRIPLVSTAIEASSLAGNIRHENHMSGYATCQALSPGPRFRSRMPISLDHGRGHSHRRRSRCSQLSAMC
jgi:hypothetical protein